MSHTPSLYTLSLTTYAELAAFTQIENGDLVFIRTGAEQGLYNFVLGAVAPGHLPAPGGYLESIYQHIFGGLFTEAGAVAQTFGVVPSKLTSWNGNSHNYRVTDDLADNQLVIQVAGIYQIATSISGTASAARAYHFHAYKNASIIPGGGILRQGTAGASLGGTSIAYETFVPGDTVSVYGSVDVGAGDFTCAEASLSAVLMG